MNAFEAFQRAYHEGRDTEFPEELTNWEWLEASAREGEETFDPVQHGYALGRLSHRGEYVTDEQGMTYSYDW